MIDWTAASPLAGRLLAITTLAPRRANSSAVSRPMPSLPPSKHKTFVVLRTGPYAKQCKVNRAFV